MSNILVLNMGMKSIRSIIFDSEGNKLASSSIPIETALMEEYVTQDPQEWWEKGCKVIQNTIDEISEKEIKYITVTTSAACLLCVDKNIQHISDCMMVSDKRARSESNEIKKCVSFPSLYERTGLDMDPYLMLPKALWIKKNEPDIYQQTYKFLAPNDYLIAKLSGGVCVTDYMNAQKWHYDIENSGYPDDLLKEIGIETDKLPKVVSPGEYIGNVSEEAAKQTGLSTKTKIIIST